MKQVTTSIIAAAMLCGVSSAHADDDGMGLGLAIKASTLGTGIEIGKSVTDSLNVRLGYNAFKRDDDQTIDDIDYQAELDFSSTALYLDWHPFEGTFHLTLGYINSSNALNASATPSTGLDPVEIGDRLYNPSDIGQLDSTVKFGSGPYAGLGWGNVPASGFGFSLELGVLQSGAPEASLGYSNLDPTVFVTQADIDLLDAEIAKEEANMQKELDEFELYPVLALGISYGF